MKHVRLVLATVLLLAIVALVLLVVPASASGPVSGGILHWPITSNPTTLDPALLTSGYEFGVAMQIFDGLTQLDQSGNAIPAIASSWTASPDVRTFTFTLRSDVYFHNGRQVKAGDFVYSWNRAKSLGGGYSSELTYTVSSYVAPSDFTFVVNLVNPFANFPVEVGAIPLFYVIPSEAAATIGTNPVGTGAFKFVSWVSNSKIRLQANSNYYGAPPYLAGVEYNIIANPNVQWTNFQAGLLDVTMIPTSTWASIKTDPNVITQSVMLMQGYGINTTAFANKNVRQAFQEAISRTAIVSNPAVWGYDPPLRIATGVVSPGKGSYDNSDIVIPYDPTNALALLAAAGWTDTNADGILDNGTGTNLTVVVQDSTAPGGHAMAQTVASNLANIGGTGVGAAVTLTTTQSAASLKRLGWISDYSDPSDDLLPYLTGGIFASRLNYNSATFNAYYATGQATLDPTARNALFHAADMQVVITDSAMLPIYYGAMTPVLKKSYVHDLRFSASGGYDQIPLKYAWLDLKYLYLPLIMR